MIKNFLKNAGLLALGCLAALLLLEIFLAFYPPLAGRVRGKKIILFPYKHYVIENTRFPKIERHIVRSNNSLGFRGPEPLPPGKKALTIIAVGGSTTECFYLSDGKSWPEQLGKELAGSFHPVWVNNAGMDGQSTFAHQILMSDYIVKLKPRVVLFLTGLNDMGLTSANRFDSLLTDNIGRPLPAKLLVWAASKSRVFALLQNFLLYEKAIKAGLVHAQLDLKTMKTAHVSKERLAALLKEHSAGAKAYAKRLEGLISLSRAHGIEPILITQPLLCGKGRDPSTGANLELLEAGPEFGNCAAEWDVLQLYNDQTRELGARLHVTVVDLADQMPKDSRYYYDTAHYTAEGAKKVADIVYRDICRPLAAISPATYTGTCPGKGRP